MKIICFTNKTDTEELKKYNKYGFDMEFANSFEQLSDANFYVVSLKYGSRIYSQFVKFMREHLTSDFIFLNEYTEILDDNDFKIRDEENADQYMYVPSAALDHIKELIDSTSD